MAEYLAVNAQAVDLNQPVIFTASIPCTRGYVYHEDETGIFILRGITCGQANATYKVTYNGNIALPEGGTAGPIAISIALNGEARQTSRAIVTPAAVEEYFNVTSTCIVKVPKGCCFTMSVRAVSGIAAGATGTPAPTISVMDSNLVIERIA